MKFDIVNGVKILYDKNIDDNSAREYLSIIKSVVEDIEKGNDIIIGGIVLLIQLISDINWIHDNYNGFFYHDDSRIEIKIELSEIEHNEKINFREVLYHELNHAIFQNKFIIRQKRDLYNKQTLGLMYIDEYLAYYTTYKYILGYNDSYYKVVTLNDYKNYCKNNLKRIIKKHNNLFENINNNISDLREFINSLARDMALLHISASKYIDYVYSIEPYKRNVVKAFDFDNIEEEICKCDKSIYEYIEKIFEQIRKFGVA